MNIKNLATYLVDETGRPDKYEKLRRCVRQTVKELHSAGLFARDLVTDSITLEAPVYPVGFNLPPNFRRLVAVQPLDSTGNKIYVPGSHNGCLKMLEPAEVFANVRNPEHNFVFIGGSTITLKTNLGVTKFLITYYTYPEISDDYLETWLMAAEEDAVIEGSLAKFYESEQNRELAINYSRSYQAAKMRIATEYSGVGT